MMNIFCSAREQMLIRDNILCPDKSTIDSIFLIVDRVGSTERVIEFLNQIGLETPMYLSDIQIECTKQDSRHWKHCETNDERDIDILFECGNEAANPKIIIRDNATQELNIYEIDLYFNAILKESKIENGETTIHEFIEKRNNAQSYHIEIMSKTSFIECETSFVKTDSKMKFFASELLEKKGLSCTAEEILGEVCKQVLCITNCIKITQKLGNGK